MSIAANPSVSDGELAVLKAIWELGETSVKDLQALLGKHGRKWAYTTVQTLANRLISKGYVESRKAGRAYLFRAIVDKEQLISRELGDIANRVCEGSASPLVMTLVRDSRFTQEEIRSFRRLLDSMEAGNARRT